MPPSNYSMVHGDFSQERTSQRINISEITIGAEYDAAEILANAYKIGVAGVVSGTLQKAFFSVIDPPQDESWPSDPAAQREMKWLVSYVDDVTGKRYQSELGPADLTDATLLVAGTDLADLTDLAWIAFVAAFEGFAVSPVENAVTIEQVRLVGRNI